MYLPDNFAETRPEVLRALMRAHPLATLVALTADGLSANHIPLTFLPGAGDATPDPDGTVIGRLQGHVARANPVWRDADPGRAVLAIFQGPQAYISPSWYATKHQHGKVVPTWNYAVVHAQGPLIIRDDPAWVHGLVSRLTDEHESRRPAPWGVGDAPADYIEQMTRAIVGIEIGVTRLTGKWKTSGNHPAANRAGVAQALLAGATDSERAMGGLVAAHDPPPGGVM